MTARTPQRQQLIDLLTPVIASEGYDLEDLSVTAAGRRSLIRITVDADNGIDLDGVATVSRSISAALDDDTDGSDPAFAGPYVLEVSSPGVDRPLTEPRHWRRAVGRLVEFPVTDNASQRVVTGRVTALEGSELVVEVAGSQLRLPLDSVGPGRVQVEFSRPGQPAAGADDSDFESDDDDIDDDDDGANDDDDDIDGDDIDDGDDGDIDDDSANDDNPANDDGSDFDFDGADTDNEISGSGEARARHKEA